MKAAFLLREILLIDRQTLLIVWLSSLAESQLMGFLRA